MSEQGFQNEPTLNSQPGAGPDLAPYLDSLPADQRQALVLRHLQRQPLADIARVMQRTPAEVATLLMSASRTLEQAQAGSQPRGVEAAGETRVNTSAATVLEQLLERSDAGETVDLNNVSTQHPDAYDDIDTYYRVAKQLDQATVRDPPPDYFDPANAAQFDTLVTDQTVQAADIRLRAAGRVAESFAGYDLLEKIAKGGMGIVYKARQHKLNRIVALKMILAGRFADGEDVERFYAEARAAANMRHPNIVAVYDVGECDGQHYFSMQYIPGHSLVEIARENSVDPRRAAKLMKAICDAVHYAHEMGIVHRDLKPANVLIDENENPLITDFGLAKRVAEKSGVTISGAILGTPSYMPPEQAAARLDDVGPRSDVYSIGAILYELLTGRPPFRASSPLETVRQVVEREPVAPRVINPDVPRDLETICLKCLQKEISNRYESAREVAEELTRYLDGQPIRARPVGRLERTWRWCRRNPVVAAALGVTATAILVALTATTIALVTTSRALTQVEQAQQRDQESYERARRAVDEGFTRIAEYELLNQPGMQPLRRELLERTLAYYEEFLQQRGDDPDILDELALTHYRIGLINSSIGTTDQALDSLKQARTMQSRLVADDSDNLARQLALSDTMTATGNLLIRMGRSEEAVTAHRAALTMRRKLVEQDDANVEYQRKLASSTMNLGLALKALSDLDGAIGEFEESQQMRNQALLLEPDNDKLQRDLGKGEFNLGNVLIARAESTDQADAIQRDLRAAVGHLEQAERIFAKLFDVDPNDFANQVQLAQTKTALADVKRYLSETDPALRDDAIRLYDQALPVLETLARMNPDVAEYQHQLASSLLNIGLMQLLDDRLDEAIASCRQAQELLAALVSKYDDIPAYRRDLAAAYRSLATAKAGQRQWNAALADLNASLAIAEVLAQRYAEQADYQHLRDELLAALETLRQLEEDDRQRPE